MKGIFLLWQARANHDEDGLTVVELVVTVIVFSAVAFITFGYFDSTTQVSGRATRNVQAETDGQIALRQLSQDIRAANPISASYPATGSCAIGVGFPPTTVGSTGYATCIRFALVRSITSTTFCTNNFEVGPRIPLPYSMVTYGLVGDTIYEDRTDYVSNCTTPVRQFTRRPVITGLVNATTGTPLFAYSSTAGVPLAADSPATSAGSVKITLVLPYQASAPNLILSTVAALRNNRGDRL